MAQGSLPTVSVVIPCFNQARFLPHAIRSVFEQSHPPIECLVVDDGSTDETVAVAELLHARVIRQPNSGVSAARNTGLAAASGELVVFLDADDALLPTALEREAAALAANPRLAAVVTRCEAMDEAGKAIPVVHHLIDTSDLYRDWLSRNFVWTPGAAMFRRADVTAIGGFAEDLGPAADYALYLRLAREGRVAFVEGTAVRYRQHATSMSRDPALMLRATMKALRGEARHAARDAVRRGRRVWCAWYGEQIVHDLRAHWHARAFGARQLAALMTLMRHCPSTVAHHVGRKARRAIVAVLKAPAGLRRASR